MAPKLQPIILAAVCQVAMKTQVLDLVVLIKELQLCPATGRQSEVHVSCCLHLHQQTEGGGRLDPAGQHVCSAHLYHCRYLFVSCPFPALSLHVSFLYAALT